MKPFLFGRELRYYIPLIETFVELMLLFIVPSSKSILLLSIELES